MTAPAIDVDTVCQLPQATVIKDKELASRGLTSESAWDRGHWLIRISTAGSRTRRRFDLAHETKHVIDAPFKRTAYRELGGRNQQARHEALEEIANHFAACVLMPKLWLTWAACNGHHDLEQLAGVFMVSPIAMRKRLRELGLTLHTGPSFSERAVRRAADGKTSNKEGGEQHAIRIRQSQMA